jgi:putative tryptophan/tyrosine transport system substrate-binding protein
VRRREFIALVGVAATAWPIAAPGQQAGRVYRIGILASTPLTTAAGLVNEFRDALRERGYVEGQNLAIDFRSPAASFEQNPEVAAELVRTNVDVILAWTTPPLIAARRATSTVPIVFVGIGDPVEQGFVASLARPGGNVTGVSNISPDLSGKLVGLLLELAPAIRRLGVVHNSQNPGGILQLRRTEGAMRALGLEFHVADARMPQEFETAFAFLGASGVKGVVMLADPSLIQDRRRIAELAQQAGLPTAFQRRESVDAGGLLSYGPNLSDQFRQAASYVDRILKGAKPADLPVEQPTKFELVINLKTAKALGLTIPPTLLVRADEVIE